ncbi:unnamed protein product [Rotaria sordida]|uniref:MACPF domain-containing protein n=1 Tax=Rotaria sordida TaxID=392033 RepID=A0A814LQB9_9BILA|nr:unnamed protein product [Rotaria sordida]
MFNQQWMLFYLEVIAINICGLQFQSNKLSNLNETELLLNETESTDSPFNLTSARAALCPIIGFQGMFCPGDDKAVTSNNITSRKLAAVLQLPHSVGMAIDVTTGDLLLPALQLSTGNRQWTENESKQTFLIPPEITLTEPSLNESSINVLIFHTETDLVDVWLKNAAAGTWTGGQLAYVQNMFDVYEKYFKDNQATAITQDLKTKYTVTIKNNVHSLKLNKYAQRAVNALTVQYNDELYENFIAAWGTHITISTKVGGMTEQQILFKSCMTDTTEITDGLSQSLFEENLKQELLEKTPCLDKFYYMRRKKLLDHRIGGNILLINNTDEWKKTIVYNPALLTVEKYLPWYDLISNKAIKRNLKQAIERRMEANSVIRQTDAYQIQEQRRNMTLSAKVVVQSVAYRWTYANDIALQNVNVCPTELTNTELSTKCNTGTMMSACTLDLSENNNNRIIISNKEVPICYERHNRTGSFRVVARRQYGQRDDSVRTGFRNYDVNGEWTSPGGCSKITNKCEIYANTWYVYLCSGCDLQCPLNQYGKIRFCKCSCPAYPIDPEAKPNEPPC